MTHRTPLKKVPCLVVFVLCAARFVQSWASIASEDLDNLIPTCVRSELVHTVTLFLFLFLWSTFHVQDALFQSLPGLIATHRAPCDSPGSSQSTPIFGDPRSSFAASKQQIQSLDSLFEDYVPPLPDTPPKKYPPSETSAEKDRARGISRQWLEQTPVGLLSSPGSAQCGDVLPMLNVPPPPPPPPPIRTEYCKPDCAHAMPCVRCGSSYVYNRQPCLTECLHCGLAIPSQPLLPSVTVSSNANGNVFQKQSSHHTVEQQNIIRQGDKLRLGFLMSSGVHRRSKAVEGEAVFCKSSDKEMEETISYR